MSALTLDIARILGVYCMLVAAIMFLRQAEMIGAVKALVASPPILMITGAFTLLIGLTMVAIHDVWNGGGLALVVTLIGWLTTIKGAGLMALPSAAAPQLLDAIRYERWFPAYMGGTFVLGVLLTAASFRT